MYYTLYIWVNGIYLVYLFFEGLCGNFNGDSTDDFKSSMKIIEQRPSFFVNSWKVTANCGPACDEESDPCSLSQVNGKCQINLCHP